MGDPSVPHVGKLSFTDFRDRVISNAEAFANKFIRPFYGSLQPVQQWIFLLTLALAIPYLYKGDFFALLRLISISVKGGEVSIFRLLSLSTVTFLLLYSAVLVINYKAKVDVQKESAKTEFKGVHPCITFSKVPEYLKGPQPQEKTITTISPGTPRFKDDFPINPAFNKVFEELATKRYTPREMPYFTDNPFDNLTGSQSKVYEALNPETPEPIVKIETLNGLDFLNQKTEKETTT